MFFLNSQHIKIYYKYKKNFKGYYTNGTKIFN